MTKKYPTTLLTIALMTSGCASGPKLAPMNPSLPIDTHDGYAQNGHPIDPESMHEVLGRERASKPHFERAQALSVVITVLAAAGGALIGWPLGQKLGGDEHPSWGLAYAGAGTLVATIPLAVWEVDSFNKAIDAHNRSVGAGSDE